MGELPEADERLKLYLEYLHIEMNIMGILSAFCAATMGGVLGSIAASQNQFVTAFWVAGHWYVVAATLFMAMAAYFFYRERSELAWYYGQLCLVIQQPNVTSHTQAKLLKDANDWDTWLEYQRAFGFACAGMILYGVAVISTLEPALQSKYYEIRVTVVAMAVAYAWYRYLQYKGRKEDP